jgi:hypothetical protein
MAGGPSVAHGITRRFSGLPVISGPMRDAERITAAIVELAATWGANKTICPSEVARHLGG